MCIVETMTDYTEQEIERLHTELAVVYRRGALTPSEKVTVGGLWARIERLQTSQAKQVMKEARVAAELRAHKEEESK